MGVSIHGVDAEAERVRSSAADRAAKLVLCMLMDPNQYADVEEPNGSG
jgi:hypothetical protein